MTPGIESTLREERSSRGLTQLAMAELAGVSRQSYAAVEAGRSVPSTEVALRLARGLGVSVESLFRLPDSEPVIETVEPWGEAAGARGPVRIVQVGGHRLGIPLPNRAGRAFGPADGLGAIGSDGRIRVELFDDAPPPCDLVAVGCDPAFDLVAAALRERRGLEILTLSRGSRVALAALANGRAHVAGIHLLDPATGAYDDTWVRRLVPFPCLRVRFASWEQCLLVRAGTPRKVGQIADLVRPGIRFLNREPGSGTRMLLDRRLAAEGIPSSEIPGYDDTAASGHLAVAEAVASGLADVGMGIQAAGSAHGLEPIPVAREWYDLVIPQHFLELPAVQALLDVLRTPGLRAQVQALGGYEVSEMGEPLGVSEPDPRRGESQR